MAGGGAQTVPCEAAPNPFPGAGPSPQPQRSTGAQVGTQTKDPEKGAPSPGQSPQSLCPVSRHTKGVAAHSVGCRGKPVWDPTGLPMRCLGEEPKVGQGRSLGDLGRNKC